MRSIRRWQITALFGCLLAFSSAFTDQLEEGEALAKSKGCFGCHGKSGNTSGEETPVIAGQPLGYLRKALLDYKSGARSGTIMSTVMSVRSDEEIDLLAEYYAAQKRF